MIRQSVNIAWKNCWRRRRRTLLTLSSLAFGYWMAVVTSSIMNYSYSSAIDNGSDMAYGHVGVLPEGYLERPRTELRLRGASQLMRTIGAMESVRSVEAKIQAFGLAATAGKTRPIVCYGVDIQAPAYADSMLAKGISGNDAVEPMERVIVGKDLAHRLGLAIGKKFVLSVTDAEGEVSSVLLRMSHTFVTGATEIDDATVVLPIGRMRQILGYASDDASYLKVMLTANRFTESVARTLRMRISDTHGVVVGTWRETQPELASYVAMDEGSGRIFVLLVIVLVALGVLNTLLMAVMERTREFGVMLALGCPAVFLAQLTLLEGFMLAIAGMALGWVLIIPMHLFLVHHGIDLTGIYGDGLAISGAIMDMTLRAVLYPMQVVVISIGFVVMCVLCAGLPAWRAMRVAPTEAMRR